MHCRISVARAGPAVVVGGASLGPGVHRFLQDRLRPPQTQEGDRTMVRIEDDAYAGDV